MKDNWKNVVGYEGIYEVSNTGLVRTTKNKTTFTSAHGIRHWKQRVLKLKTDKNGYKRVSLWKDGQHHDWLVHRLVAESFIKNQNEYNLINHLDGNPSNNNIDNLEWCDSYINNNHAFDNNLIKTSTKIILENLETGELLKFRSMVKASEFLGKYQTYVGRKLKFGEHEFEGYRCYKSLG